MKFINISNLVLQTACIGLNLVSAGNSFRHHKYGATVFSLGCAVFLVVLNLCLYLCLYRSKKRRDAAQARWMAQQDELIRVLNAAVRNREDAMASPAAIEMAQKNLALVVRATGAKSEGGYYSLNVGKKRFLVASSRVCLRDRDNQVQHGTCIENHDRIPEAEMVATLLLLLKHNPGLYESWRDNHGAAYDADGLVVSHVSPIVAGNPLTQGLQQTTINQIDVRLLCQNNEHQPF